MPTWARSRKQLDPAVAEKKSEDAEKKAFRKARDEFYAIQKKVDLILQRLLQDYERAKGKYNLFKSTYDALSNALKALQTNEAAHKEVNEAARKEANEAKEALSKELEKHTNHPDELTIEALKKAVQDAEKAMQDAENARNKPTQEVETAISEVKTVYARAIDKIQKGNNQSSSYEEENRKIKKFFEETRYILELKSSPNLRRATYFWEYALKEQETIYNLYDEEQFSGLQAKAIKNMPSLAVTDLRQAQSNLQSLKLDDNGKKIVEEQNKKLRKEFQEMSCFHGLVKSAEQKRVRDAEKQGQQTRAKP